MRVLRQNILYVFYNTEIRTLDDIFRDVIRGVEFTTIEGSVQPVHLTFPKASSLQQACN